MNSTQVLPSLALLAGAYLGVVACAGGGDNSGQAVPVRPGGSGGNATDAASNEGLGTGGDNHATADASAGGGSTDTEMCAAAVEPAQLQGVNLIFMLDRSASMGAPNSQDAANINERWYPVTQGLLAFFGEPTVAQHNASLEFFPAEGNVDIACSVPQYETPCVPLLSLDEEGTAPFIAAIDTAIPAGGTPTLPALQGAIDYAIAVAIDYPSSATVVVLVTDGEPGFLLDDVYQPGCENNDIEHVAEVARAAFEGDPQIFTYVIGVGPELEALDTIANAGGTEKATMVPIGNPDETEAIMELTLANIGSAHVGCGLGFPDLPQGLPFCPDNLHLRITDANGERTILAAPTCDDGAPFTYDDPVEPTRIAVCPEVCDAVWADVTTELEYIYECVSQFSDCWYYPTG